MDLFFKYITPATYLFLVIIWSYIFVFYLKKINRKDKNDKLLNLLLLILAIDAFRTLFESIYFGAWYTSLSGLLPIEIFNYLAKPQIVFFPKIFNLIAAILVLTLLIKKWLPSEIIQKDNFNLLINNQLVELRVALTEAERSEFLLNEAGRMAKIGAWEFDLATQKTRWSDQVFALHAIPVGDVPDFDYIMGCYIEGSEEILRKSIEECITMRKIYELELRFMNARNEKLWVRAIGYPIMNDLDEIVSLRGVVQDITGIKHSEIIRNELNEILLIEQKRLLESQTIAKVGSWTTDLPSLKVTWSNETHHIFGTDPETFHPMHTDFLELVHPDDKQKVDTAFVDSFNDSLPHEIEHRMLTLDNQMKFVVERWKVIHDKEGNPLRVTGTCQDITEQKEIILNLIESQNRYQTLFENQPTIIWEEDFSLVKQGFDQLKNEGVNNFREYFDKYPDVVMELAAKVKIIEINKTSLEILEAETKDEIIKNLSYYFDTDEAWEIFKEELIYLAEGSILFESEIPVRTIKGNNKQLYLKLVVLPDYTQDLKRVLITFQDITELKESTLKSNDYANRLKTTLESISDAFVSLDNNWCYTYMNKKAGEFFGKNPEDMIGKNIWTEFPEGVGQPFYHTYYKAIETQEFQFMREYYPPYDLWFENRIYPSKDGLSIFFTDITETKKKEIEILEYQKSLQLMTTEISLIEEKQRRKIAENIHDHLSQSLVISKMKLKEFIKKNDLTSNSIELNAVVNHLSDAIENSRKITYDLSPPVLYELGLIETMYWLADKLQNENPLEVSFETNQEYIKLSDEDLILIFRTIQELITNILKHANASKVSVVFNIQPEYFEIEIADDGVGFDGNLINKFEKNKSGFGLFSIKERIRNLAGTIIFDTEIGKGTRVKIVFPVSNKQII